MVRRILPFVVLLLVVAGGVWLAVRPDAEPPAVVIYTSVDDEIARGILGRFERETGIKPDVRTDTEATKSVGLANTLREEGRSGSAPRCDVFWNNEPVLTTRLAAEGILEAYASPAAKDVPGEWKHPRGFWVSNGLRARIFIVNPAALGERRPASFRDLADKAFRDKGAMARPIAGTTFSHMAALRSHLGPLEFAMWFKDMAANETAFASGNGAVAREVGRGARAFGFTDTDDFCVRKSAGDPVEAVFPDQRDGECGTFVLPVTVSVVRGAPHPANARRLFDWLVSAETEAALSASSYATIPVRPTTKPGPGVCCSLTGFRAAVVDWDAAKDHLEAVQDLVKEVLLGR